ncbi:MAG: PorP/SprF family type IX secretion system membrane protein [Bacteroidales bacterium]|nr:PorP/SprF family type IX secretion system membrane protein [Bacteroidales bacterium]
MMSKYLKYIALLLLLFGGMIKGQDYIQSSEYIINPYALNQAMAGYFGYPEIHLDYRKQWLKIYGGPETYNISAFGNLYQEKMWLGGEAYRDQTGPLTRIKANLSYSYILKTGENQHLFFGIWGSYYQNSINLSNLVGVDPNDPLLNHLGTLNGNTFNVGFGLVYNSRNFNFGFAMPNALTNKNIYLTPDKISFDMQREYLFHVSNLFWLSDNWEIQAMGVYQKTINEPGNLDVSATFFLAERFWVGTLYRSSGVVAFNAGGYLVGGISVNYAYELGMSGIYRYSGPSNEISLSFRFGMKGGSYYRNKNAYSNHVRRIKHRNYRLNVPQIID